MSRAALACLALGALAALGFAPLEWWPLSLLAIAGWMALIHDAPSLRAALWRGWLFGLGHFTVNDNWIGHAFDFQQAMPSWLGYLAPPLLALYLAVYPMLAAGVAWRLAAPRAVGDRSTRPGWSYVLTFAAAWIATEYLRATTFTGYAWDPLGVIWVPVRPVASLAAWMGTYALSGLTLAGAGALLLAMRGGFTPRAGAVAVLIALTVAQMRSYPPQGIAAPVGSPRVRIVQPNIGQDERGETDGERMLRALGSLSGRPGPAPRLLLWPEGVVRDSVEDGYPWRFYVAPDGKGGWAFHPPGAVRRRLARLLGPRDILLTGGDALQFTPEGDLKTVGNSVFAVSPAGRLIDRYDKAHLVPYGEYLPVRPLLSAIGLSRLVPGDVDFAPGPGPRALDLPGIGAIGVQVCYEIIFSGEVIDERHRPRALFNPSNDAWFGGWGPPQHLAQARMRAIEEGLPVLRATPTGISAIIGADGAILAAIPHDRAGAIELPLPPPLPPTPFARLGNLMAALVAVSFAALAVALARRAR